MSQRLSPAERARLASKPTDLRSRAKRKTGSGSTVKSSAAKLSGQGAVQLQHWFDKIFKAQSIHFYQLLGVTLFLVIFGVIMVLSASSVDSLKANNNSFAVAGKQLFFAVLGLLAMSAVSLLPLGFIKSRARFVFVASMALQIGVLFFGKEINGNRNWIEIFGFTLQPSEFLKIAVILHISAYLATKVEYFDDRSVWVRALIISGAAMGVVFLGKDLGTVIIMLIAFIGMLALAGMPSKLLNLVGVVLVVLVPIALSIGSSRLGRIMAWLNPNAPDPNDYNWQSEHGMWAISAGRIFGAGLGESKMKWSWIPEVENDFIFAIISEELGLLGALLVIALFVSLAVSFVRILQRTQDYFGKFVVGGVMLWIVFQALINIAVVLRLLPVLGVPLPLISAGGSSLVATLGAIGVVLAIERENHTNPIANARPVRSRR